MILCIRNEATDVGLMLGCHEISPDAKCVCVFAALRDNTIQFDLTASCGMASDTMAVNIIVLRTVLAGWKKAGSYNY